MVLAISDEAVAATNATALPPALASKPARPGGAAYVCRGSQCSAALGSLELLLAELTRKGS
jgi:uncharacterized protein YyaL (SSP411 family)